MLKKFTIYLLFFSTIWQFTIAQKPTFFLKPAEKVDLLINALEKKHCEPRKIDNVFSEQLFDAFLKNLDEHRSIFTATDEAELAKFRNLLDDQIKAKDLVFLAKTTTIYRNRLQKIDTLIQKITEKPIDFYAKSTLQPERISYAKDEKEWKEHWQNELKYQIFRIVFNSISTDKNTKPNFNDKVVLAQKENLARKRVRETNLRQIKKLLSESVETFEAKVASNFLQSVANLYDKHTEYYGLEEAFEFIRNSNPQKEIFGFRLDENKNGEIEISNLVPGSSAWKSGLLNKGDVIVALQWEGKEEIDVIGLDESEINEIIANGEGNTLSLTVRKVSQEIVKVKLVKTLIVQDEQGVRGFLVENKEKFGYINLPAFYSDFEDNNGLGCANDVAKELVKMNQEGIKGLILDLRFNGGGSLKEALDLAGIFIDQGVFGAYKANSPKSYIAKDPNRGSIYDGPMVVLVNKASASASEILAGILQDYKRAVIVGAKTYGKGVAQTIFPLDTLTKFPTDFAKATVFRIFRPSGKALQTKGVIPDIILPSILDSLTIGEKHDGYFLSADTLMRVLQYSPLSELAISNAAQKSKERVKNIATFQAIEKLAGKIKNLESSENKPILLDWAVFQQEFRKERDEVNNLMKASDLPKANFTVSLTSLEQQRSQLDNYWKELNEQIFESLKKDIYLEEAIQILLDLKRF